MIICIAGRNTLASECLDIVLDDFGFDYSKIIAVCSKKDQGKDGFEPSLRRKADLRSVRICELEEVYDIEEMILFSLQYDRILKPKLFKSSKLFNFHFSLLPEFKGMYPSVMPILYGKNYSGVTVHIIDEGIDTGAIIVQKTIPITIDDTSRSLYFKYLKAGVELFKDNFPNLISDNYSVETQSQINSTYFSKESLNFANYEINFRKTSFEIHNQIRAMIFPEYQLPIICGQRIVKSILTDERIERNMIFETSEYFILSGIDGYKILAYKESAK